MKCWKAQHTKGSALNLTEFFRFCINGGVATLVHFSILMLGIEVLHIPSAGVANGFASLFGITASFLGNRWFVFPKTGSPVLGEFIKFSGLYALIAVLHGSLLFVWSDQYGFDYRVGFIWATGVQVVLSYFANKCLVFK